MSIKILNIPEFCCYLNVGDLKSDDLHIVDFDNQNDIRLKSEPVTINFKCCCILDMAAFIYD